MAEYKNRFDIKKIEKVTKATEEATKSAKEQAEATKKQAEALKTVKEQQDELNNKIAKGREILDAFYTAIPDYNRLLTSDLNTIIDSTTRLKVDISSLAGLHEKNFEILTAHNKAQLESAQKEIDVIKTKKENINKLSEAYNKQRELVAEQAVLEEVKIKQRYKLYEEAAEQMANNQEKEAILLKLTAEQDAEVARVKEQTQTTLIESAGAYYYTMTELTKQSFDELLANSEKVKQHTSGAWKGVVDVEATRASFETAKLDMENYLNAVTFFGENIIGEYQKQIDATNITSQEKERLQKEQKAFMDKHNKTVLEEVSNVNKKKEELDKKSQDLRIQQTEEYAKKYKALMDNVTNKAEAIQKPINSVLGDLSSMFKMSIDRYDAEVKTIDEKLKELETREVPWKDTDRTAEFEKKKAGEIKKIAENEVNIAAYKVEMERLKGELPSKPEGAQDTGQQEEQGKEQQEKEQNKLRLDQLTSHLAEEESAKKNSEQEQALIAQQALEYEKTIANEKSVFESQKVAEKEKLEKDKLTLEEKKKRKERDMKKVELTKQMAEMGINISKATGDIAAGAANALSYGPFLGPVLSAMVTGAGVLQIAIMVAQMANMGKHISKLENGGLLSGKRHSEGGMRIEGSNIEVEGGEYVVNRDSTRKNMGLVKYINSQRRELSPDDINNYFDGNISRRFETPFQRMFENGGELPSVHNTVSVDNSLLVEAIREIKFEPKVAVTDIIRAQDDMARIDNWAGM